MHFSCKITNSFITYLEAQGEDLSPLFESSPLSVELMRDSSYWMRAPDMEVFLESVLAVPLKNSEPDLIQKVGHLVPRLRSWGVLDSVLRMMPKPQEIFQQPERFLSYFISPEPPVESILRTQDELSFALPLPAEQYPLTSLFLRSAFEALPLYTGQELATCEWKDIHIKIKWPKEQESMFLEDPGHQISPDLLSSVIEELQKNQRELEEKNRELQGKNEELKQTHKELQAKSTSSLASASSNSAASSTSSGDAALGVAANLQNELSQWQSSNALTDEPLHKVMQNLSRLHDYMVRAQQLVTMLSSQNKLSAGTKEALRRVDWDFVKVQYPRIFLDSIETIRAVKAKSQLTNSSGGFSINKKTSSQDPSKLDPSKLDLPKLDPSRLDLSTLDSSKVSSKEIPHV